MSAHDELEQRQRRLLTRSTELRVAMAYEARPLAAPAALADRGLALARGLRDAAAAHPLWVAGGVALLVALKPRRAWRWARRGWGAWRLLRRLRPWFSAPSRGS